MAWYDNIPIINRLFGSSGSSVALEEPQEAIVITEIEKQYRPVSPMNLSEDLRLLKLELDLAYETEVHLLSDPFYKKKRDLGVTEEEEAEYKNKKVELWGKYVQAAIDTRIYEEVNIETLLEEEMVLLNMHLTDVNNIRKELSLKEFTLVER